jgi:hypothetical protein
VTLLSLNTKNIDEVRLRFGLQVIVKGNNAIHWKHNQIHEKKGDFY